MATSNRTAVENNKIPDGKRLDIVASRNGTTRFGIVMFEQDADGNETQRDFTGWSFMWVIKSSYESANIATTGQVTVTPEGALSCKLDMTKARGLGISMEDAVHDCVGAPSGGIGEPELIWSGLLGLSKGVGSGTFP